MFEGVSHTADPISALFGHAAPDETNPVALVVDDDPAVRRLATYFLVAQGWSVIEAHDGRAGLALFDEHHPDLVMMDLDMPTMNGLEATRQLRTMPAGEEVPVVILCSDEEAQDVLVGLEAGADGYVRKPIRKREFQLRLQSLTRIRKAWRRTQEWWARLGEQTRALSLLLDFSMTLSHREDLESIIETTIDVTAQLSACQRISIMLPDQRTKALAIVGATGVAPSIVRSVRLGFGDSVAGKVFETGKPVLINSDSDVARVLDGCSVRFFEGLPMLSLPMYAAEKIVGVINMTSRIGARPFDASELNFLNLLMNFAASAIQSVRNRQARDEARDSIVFALAKLAEHRDDDTGTHLDRVTQYCLCLCAELRMAPEFANVIDGEFIRNIERAAPLHDIGKVAIPDAVLLKPGKFNEEEMAIMRNHTSIGAETLHSLLERAPDSKFLMMAEDIAESHHEWYNGKGYPNGRAGEDIPLAARIVAMADVYDALTTRRVYKPAWSHEKAMDIIRQERGSHFDPHIVDAFLRIHVEFERLSRELADPVETERTEGNGRPFRKYRSARARDAADAAQAGEVAPIEST